MPTYKNVSGNPIAVQCADGRALSIPTAAEFDVDIRTSNTIDFQRMVGKKVKEVKPPEPEPASEKAAPTAPSSDSPGRASELATSAPSVAPSDAQDPVGDTAVSDEASTSDDSSGEPEPEPGEGATEDEPKKRRGRRSRSWST